MPKKTRNVLANNMINACDTMRTKHLRLRDQGIRFILNNYTEEQIDALDPTFIRKAHRWPQDITMFRISKLIIRLEDAKS